MHPNLARNSHKESYGSNDMVHASVHKITNNNPVEPKNHTHKPGRQNGIGQRFSLNKSSVVHEKPHTPRSCLMWKPTGKIFKTVSLRWIPTGMVSSDSTTKVDSDLQWFKWRYHEPYEAIKLFMLEQGTSKPSCRAFTALANSLLPNNPAFWETLTHDAKTGLIAFKLDEKCLTEAEEEVVAREVHATHARIMSESEPEPTQRRQSGIAFRDSFIVSKKRSSDSSKKLKGIQTLTPAKQEAADIMKALKESKKMSKRQPGTGGSNEGTDINGKPLQSIQKSTTNTTSPISPKITYPFIALQLRVARLEQEMFEVKKTDHSADVLASIKSQVPTAVVKYLGTKLDDALLKALKLDQTGSQQKRRRHDSSASGSAQPPTKDDSKVRRKPRKSDVNWLPI
ncbi:hypothetical protein Tco_1252607 [Tanacetum coccineum]